MWAYNSRRASSARGRHIVSSSIKPKRRGNGLGGSSSSYSYRSKK
jgi:hypothetical protein